MKSTFRYILAGCVAGAINGLLGAGGGMLLVPILSKWGHLEENQVFPASVAIILPICLISLCISPGLGNLPWSDGWPYLVGALPGGLLAGFLERKIPVKWLHRALGLLLIWGGVRNLC